MKSNAILDTNYILNKYVFALSNVKELDKLNLAMTNCVKDLIASVPHDNFILATDSGSSWRKTIYPEYKANRKDKAPDIDWKVIYQMYDEFKQTIVQQSSAKLLSIKSAEGDDLISQIVQKSNLKGYSNVIIASDRDLLQHVTYQYDPDFINVMVNEEFKNSKIYIPVGGEEFLDNLRKKNNKNVFFMGSDNSQFIRYVDEQMAKREVVESFSEEKLFVKIINGDGKDNVKSTHYKYNLEKGTKRGIGDGTALKIYERYKYLNSEPINFKSKDFIIRAKNVIAENRKIQSEEEMNDVQKNLIQNTKLIMLDPVFLPKELRAEIDSQIDQIL